LPKTLKYLDCGNNPYNSH